MCATLSLVSLGWGIGGSTAVTGLEDEEVVTTAEVRKAEPIAEVAAATVVPRREETKAKNRELYPTIDLPACREPKARRRDRMRAEALWDQGIAVSKQVGSTLQADAATALRREALGLFIAASVADPTLAKPYNSIGGVAYDQGADVEAECFYKLAMDHDPDLRWPYVNLGKLGWTQRRCKFADEWLDEAIRRGSEEANGIKHWVEVARRRGECRE